MVWLCMTTWKLIVSLSTAHLDSAWGGEGIESFLK